MKIATIIGARPQFIKAAAISRALKNYPHVREIIIHTGQHYDSKMSSVFFEELDIPQPDFNLGIGGGSHGAQTGKMLESIENVLLECKPDWVLVYGDTNSTLAGALAASKLHIPVAHVEAGLRSFNRKMPEEINRILTDHLSSILFIPTSNALKNLSNEGIDPSKVVNVGDVMYDAALFYGLKSQTTSKILDELELNDVDFLLTTIHRAENTDDEQKLFDIFKNLELISRKIILVLPLHPRTDLALNKIKFDRSKSSIRFIDPIGYMDMVLLEKKAKVIITDSGGVQKEAFFHKTPCITLRDETEWTELIELKVNQLIKDFNDLEKAVKKSLELNSAYFDAEDIFGDGNSAEKIISALLKYGEYNL